MKRVVGCARRIVRRVGRRGASLLFVGLLAAALSWSMLPVPAALTGAPFYRMLASILPLAVWGALWGVTAVVSLVQAFTRSDRVAFALGAAMLAAWGLIYVTSWVQNVNDRGWIGGAIFIAFSGWITLISTWPEAIDLRRFRDPDGAAIIVADRDGTITGWNDAAAGLFGWQASQIVGQDLTVLMPKRFRRSHEAAMDRTLSTGHSALAGRVITLTGLHRDGTEFPLELMLSMSISPGGPTYTGVIYPNEKAR